MLLAAPVLEWLRPNPTGTFPQTGFGVPAKASPTVVGQLLKGQQSLLADSDVNV